MRIEQAGKNAQSIVNNGVANDRLEKGKVKNGSINAAGLNLLDDEIANRKQKAVEDAMKFIKDQYKADGKVDEALDSCRQRSEESQKLVNEAREELKVLEEEKEQMMEACGGEDTEEFKTYLKEDYSIRKSDWIERKENAQKEVLLQEGIIRSVKKEMVKNRGMIDADNAKDAMLDASGKEITGMLIEEAKEKIDETIEEDVEKGEEQKDKADELEGKLDEIQAKLKKQAMDAENQSKEVHQNSKVTRNQGDAKIDMDRLYDEMNRHTNEVLELEKLLPEDIKGAIVDEIF